MFTLTSHIEIGQYAVKPSAVEWKSSTGDYTDTCTITLPLSPFVRHVQHITEHADGVAESVSGSPMRNFNEVPFRKGDAVRVCVGYDGRTEEVFRGFVSTINFANQMLVECEGYSYQLRDRHFNKSYQKTTLKQLLTDLCAGTGIKLSAACDNVPLTDCWFKNAPGLKVLEWVQKELCCRVWFDGEWLYAGASKYVKANPDRPTADVKVRIGWNTVSADDLKKQIAEEVQINIVEKDSSGSTKKTKSGNKKYSDIKEVKVRAGLPSDYLKKVAAELQQEKDCESYEGGITLFGEPHVWKADRLTITDKRFPERSGNYFAEEIDGSYGNGGLRRTVKLRYYGKNS